MSIRPKLQEPVGETTIPEWRIKDAVKKASIESDIKWARKLLKQHLKSPNKQKLDDACRVMLRVQQLENSP